MVKNRYFTVLLILLVLLTGGIFFKAHSQIQSTPPKFRVAVNVSCEDNQAHQSLVEGVIKRELRSFGDVQIVGNEVSNGLWKYMIDVHLFGIKDSYGKIGQYAMSYSFFEKVPIENFVPDSRAFYRKYPAVYLPIKYTGYVGINKLEESGKTIAANFDNKHLQPIRDIRIRYSR